MENLAQEQVLKDIQSFKHEWIIEESWWYGSTTAYKNTQHGYDCEVYHLDGTEEIWCVVYPLHIRNGDLECNSDKSILEFEIKLEKPIYEIGNILESIFAEEHSPFEVGKRYLITNVSEIKKEDKTVKIYTLNDHCDFKYTNYEIEAYFKKAVLS